MLMLIAETTLVDAALAIFTTLVYSKRLTSASGLRMTMRFIARLLLAATKVLFPSCRASLVLMLITEVTLLHTALTRLPILVHPKDFSFSV